MKLEVKKIETKTVTSKEAVATETHTMKLCAIGGGYPVITIKSDEPFDKYSIKQEVEFKLE